VLSHPVGLYGEYIAAGITHVLMVNTYDSAELMFVLLMRVTSRRYMIATLVGQYGKGPAV
jgi:hypothetical protein